MDPPESEGADDLVSWPTLRDLAAPSSRDTKGGDVSRSEEKIHDYYPADTSSMVSALVVKMNES
jgi:hypothetical protein